MTRQMAGKWYMPEMKSKAIAASSLTPEKISLNVSHFLVFNTKPKL